MKIALLLGAIFALFAVALGAFGAHALKDKFAEPRYAETWETAVRYQMYHGLALLCVGIMDDVFGGMVGLTWATYLLAAGVIVFSGSLYVLSITGIRKLGAITPIGGVLLLAGRVVSLQPFYK